MQRGQVRQQFADLDAALAVLRNWNGTGIRPPVGFSVRSWTACGPLAGVLVDGRLGVEKVGAEGAAVHEQVDDALGTGTDVRSVACRFARQRMGREDSLSQASRDRRPGRGSCRGETEATCIGGST